MFAALNRISRNLFEIHSTLPVVLVDLPPATPLFSVGDEYRIGEDLCDIFLRLQSDPLGDHVLPFESPSRLRFISQFH